MSVPSAAASEARQTRPRLIFFYSPRSGQCRRVEGFLAQVCQRRHNHETFDLTRVSVERRPDLAERFGVETLPTLLVVEGNRVQRRIVRPRGCRELEEGLRQWLR
jgi:thioredoxin-like negative regulator of GroEL